MNESRKVQLESDTSWEFIILIICIFLFFFLFAGSPDIHDALIDFVKSKSK